MRHEPQGLERWANTDQSLHFNTIDPSKPDWRNEYVRLLIEDDNDAAHTLRLEHDPEYAAECWQCEACSALVLPDDLRTALPAAGVEGSFCSKCRNGRLGE